MRARLIGAGDRLRTAAVERDAAMVDLRLAVREAFPRYSVLEIARCTGESQFTVETLLHDREERHP